MCFFFQEKEVVWNLDNPFSIGLLFRCSFNRKYNEEKWDADMNARFYFRFSGTVDIEVSIEVETGVIKLHSHGLAIHKVNIKTTAQSEWTPSLTLYKDDRLELEIRISSL